MKQQANEISRNRIARFLNKSPEDFTKADLIKYIEANDIEMVNFRHMGKDGTLKTLNFVIHSNEQLDRMLSAGERVDGSSLLSAIDAASSDLYLIPRYKTAFVNPFAEVPTVDILCSYYTHKGVPLPSAPEQILRKAQKSLKDSTGMTMEALGELEYYIFYDSKQLYPATTQAGYQESSPFSKWEQLRYEAMNAIAQAGGRIKYGHSEVGNIREGKAEMEQHEIEFLPVSLEDAADQLVIAKWIVRMIGYKYGVNISFAPKIMRGHAGSGLHIHTRLIKDGQSMMIKDSALSDTAKKAISGYLDMAPSLTAFGNTVPTSYLRLVPHQEAPTNICWGDRNRSVLVRVPLGWLNVNNMAKDANAQDNSPDSEISECQTVEFRCPDGSADVYMLLAGLAVAARHGLEMEDALKLAEKLYVDVNIFSEENKAVQEKLPQLPDSCWESARNLIKDRKVYEKDGVFPSSVIDELAKKLKDYKDKNLSELLYGKEAEIQALVDEYLHC